MTHGKWGGRARAPVLPARRLQPVAARRQYRGERPAHAGTALRAPQPSIPRRQLTGSSSDSSCQDTEPNRVSPGAGRAQRARRLRVRRGWPLGRAPGLRDVPVDEVLVAATDHELPRGPRRVRSGRARKGPSGWRWVTDSDTAGRLAGPSHSTASWSSSERAKKQRRVLLLSSAPAVDGRRPARRARGLGPHLARDGDLVVLLVPDRAAGLVGVIEDDGHARLCDPRLPLLVHELLQVARTHLRAPSGARSGPPRRGSRWGSHGLARLPDRCTGRGWVRAHRGRVTGTGSWRLLDRHRILVKRALR